MSRLPEIKARLKACENTGYGSPAMVEDMKLLLAVVEAIRKDWTPAIMAEAARTTASHMTGKGREEWLELAEAWEGLAEKLEAIEAE